MIPSALTEVERWVIRVGVFLLPLAYFWNTYDRYLLPKLLLARALVIVLVVMFIARAIAVRRLIIKRTPLDLPLVIIVISATLSTLVAENRNIAIFGTYARYDGLLTIASYALLFWLIVQGLRDANDARQLLRVVLASGYLVAGVAVIHSIADSVAQGTFVPAFGSLGQKNVAGMFLAMLLPLAFWEVIAADRWNTRVIALNVVILVTAALLMSLSRSAWLGAAAAAGVVIVARRPTVRVVVAAASMAVLVMVAIGALSVASLGSPDNKVHLSGLTLDVSVWGGEPARPHVWQDSLRLIATRPILGYGPDNFGLVYPRFQSIDLGRQPFDKAHAESLQIAATQGLLGLAAYALLLVMLARAFWPARSDGWAVAIFAGIVAYQVALQLNFTSLAAAFPFWAIAAAAMQTWGATKVVPGITWAYPVLFPVVGAALIAALTLGVTFAVVRPYLADRSLAKAVTADLAGRVDVAQAAASDARSLAPDESVYAVEVGNLAFERQDWNRAHDAYLDAARLGTYNALVFRNLALADRSLGRPDDARMAARQAFELDRFDPANRALLAQFEPLPS